MPILYQWNGNIDKLNTFSWLISPEVVQMILVLKKTNISWNNDIPPLCLFLVFEHNVNCSMSLWHYSDVTGVLQLLNSSAIWLVDQQLVRCYDKAVSVSKSRITGGFPHKGTVMWRSRMRASPSIICMICNRLNACAVSHPDDIAIGNISSGWLMVNVLCHPDDIA